MNQINMNNKYILLNCDDDILSLEKDIFKVSRFKELLIQKMREKLTLQLGNSQLQNQGTIIKCFKDMTIAEEFIEINSLEFQFFKDCQLLIISSKNWQPGKLKVEISISPIGKHKDEIRMEFYPNSWDEALPLENWQKSSKNMTYSK